VPFPGADASLRYLIEIITILECYFPFFVSPSSWQRLKRFCWYLPTQLFDEELGRA
jgi:hypothetical protein